MIELTSSILGSPFRLQFETLDYPVSRIPIYILIGTGLELGLGTVKPVPDGSKNHKKGVDER